MLFMISFVKDSVNIVFHLSVRFDEERNVIVANSQVNNSWGEEERKTDYFPFEPSQPFEMEIQYEEKYFNVTVNDQFLLQFMTREKTMEELSKVFVEGDVSVQNIRVETLSGETNKECEELPLTT
ncbi:galectin-3 [Microcaecilia unicolor]|uniref:Galectin n=1 Tax=Microcaecilia unicolor TaxID=1415580 RepID=A0A6P7Z1B6_9AMPH|nr:galectin-3-like [Microcaecilia unicolor]